MERFLGKTEEDDEIDHLAEMEEEKVVEAFGEKIGNLLIEYGYDSLSAISNATDDELLDISGVGEGWLRTIREYLEEDQPTDLSGVSEDSATDESEVKPVSIEAEAAEDSSAELSSAEEAVIADTAPMGATAVIRSLWPQPIGMTAPSGATYHWESSGAQVNVLAEDVQFVMGKNRKTGRACCGSSGERIYFELM
jgi:hypothetical protein